MLRFVDKVQRTRHLLFASYLNLKLGVQYTSSQITRLVFQRNHRMEEVSSIAQT
jgi:hypothetical protein